MSTESQVMALLEEGNPAIEATEASWSGTTAAAYLATLQQGGSDMTQLEKAPEREAQTKKPIGVWIAAAAAALVLGVVALLLTQNSDEAPVATTPTETTVSDLAPTTIAAPPTTIAQAETTQTTSVPPTTAPPVASIVLTIGDQTWEFDGATCASIGGPPGAPGAELDVSHQQGDLEVYVNDDSGGRHVSINDHAGDGTLEWVAETGSVFIFIDGNTVTAEGTFTDMVNDLPRTEGTLTATCSAWREG